VIGAGAVITCDTDEGDVFVVAGTPLHATRSWDLDGF
jgi:hypothetical protein